MFQIFKVLQLPNNPRPNSFYYVSGDEDWGYTDAYLTDKDGHVRSITNKAIIDSIVNQNIDAVAPIVVVDIAARDALVLTRSQLVYVEDASDDPQVSFGPAMYLWNPNTSTYANVSQSGAAGDSILDGGNF